MPLRGIGYVQGNKSMDRRPAPTMKSKLSPGRLRKKAMAWPMTKRSY